MAITDGANRNPASASAGQPQANSDAGVRAASGKIGVAGGGDTPVGPNAQPGPDAGTAAAMKKGRQSNGSTTGNGNSG